MQRNRSSVPLFQTARPCSTVHTVNYLTRRAVDDGGVAITADSATIWITKKVLGSRFPTNSVMIT
jgi:hypothetical protein